MIAICYSFEKEIARLNLDPHKYILHKIGVGKKHLKKNIEQLEHRYSIDFFFLIGFAGAVNSGFKVGDIVYEQDLFTVDKIFDKKDKIKLKKENPQIKAVDMEALYFAEIMKNKNAKYFIVKAVSDTSDFVMPKSMIMLKYLQRMHLKFLFEILKNPIDCLRLLKLRRNCGIAGKVLGKYNYAKDLY